MLSSRNADVPRALVRDMYTKSWSAFDRLVAIVPPGGSIGFVSSVSLADVLLMFHLLCRLDDKLFSFWLLQGDSFPFSHVKGIFRFETGIKVNEFRDLRANPRTLLESQVLSLRVRWSRMIATGVLGTGTGRGRGNISQAPSPSLPGRSSSVTSSLGLPFDPYDYMPLPGRILATGAATNFPSVANLVGDIFNAPIFVPSSQVDSAQISPHRNAPASGFPGRASLGGAYIARWVWGKERAGAAGGSSGAGGRAFGFEDEIRRLLGKRWVATGGMPLKTNINGTIGVGGGLPGSGANSGTSTPYGHGPRSGLGSNVVVEEDEEEVEEMERHNGGYGFGEVDSASRMRTQTNSTVDSLLGSSHSLGAPSSAFTTPDMNTGLSSPDPNSGSPATPTTTTTPLTPVSAMPTSDSEKQIGLAKVAEPDVDAFMTYAAIVPEYCRLENMLVKSLV